MGRSRYPPTDILETPEKYIMQVQLPGFMKENISVRVHSTHSLVLSGVIHNAINVEEEARADELREEAKKTEEAQAKLSKDLASQGQSDKSVIEKAKEFIASQEKKIEALLKKNGEDHQKFKVHYTIKERDVPESFTRTYSFHSDINPEGINVGFQNGILMIIVSKISITQRININID